MRSIIARRTWKICGGCPDLGMAPKRQKQYACYNSQITLVLQIANPNQLPVILQIEKDDKRQNSDLQISF